MPIFNPISQGNDSNKGKSLDLSATATFVHGEGSNFVINCTADAEFNPKGSFPEAYTVAILNTGIGQISFDSTHAIQPGQRAWFTWDGTQFVGGV